MSNVIRIFSDLIKNQYTNKKNSTKKMQNR